MHCPACAILNNMLCRFGIHVQGKLVRCAFFRHTRARENTFFLRNKKDVSEWGVPQKLDKYLIIKLLLATEFGTVPDSVLLVLWIFFHCCSTLCTRAISV